MTDSEKAKKSKSGKELDKLTDLEYQVDDIVKQVDYQDLENIKLPKEIKKRIENSKPGELKTIEKELGLHEDDRELINKLEEEVKDFKYAMDTVIEQENVEEGTDCNGIYVDEEEENVDGSFSIEISEDKMSATISLTPSRGKGNPLSYESIKKAIEEKGIVYGVNHDLLKRLVENVEKTKSAKEGIVIAQGTLPEEGEDGKIEFHFSESDRIFFENNRESSKKDNDKMVI